MDRIVVVGAGQAGATLVARLRSRGYGGALTLVGAEPVPPYQRPPLSKSYLMGKIGAERLFLRPESFYGELAIDLCTGVTAVAIDRAAQRVLLGDGTALPYDALVLTTGAEPRRLPAAIGGDLPGVHTIRALPDIDAVAPAMRPGARLLVVGGGYIGLETAAVAAGLGLDVTLVEAAPRILQRVASPQTADYFRALHTRHGVTLREATAIARLTGAARVTGAVLADGDTLPADVVVVGIGVEPRAELARAAGLAIAGGIVVDAGGRTGDPAIWAAGDCTVFPRHGAMIRIESVQNAIDQAEAVADALLGSPAPYDPQPWFWSDQYDVKLQIAGLNTGYTHVVERGGERPGAHSVWYYDGPRLIAVDAMNDPRAYMQGKRWIEAGVSPDAAAIGIAADLRTLA